MWRCSMEEKWSENRSERQQEQVYTPVGTDRVLCECVRVCACGVQAYKRFNHPLRSRSHLICEQAFSDVDAASSPSASEDDEESIQQKADAALRKEATLTWLELNNHPHCVEFLGAVEERAHRGLLFELCSGGSLTHYLYVSGANQRWIPAPAMRQLSLQQKCQCVREIMMAVFFLHKRGYVHRDIKSENVQGRTHPHLRSRACRISSLTFPLVSACSFSVLCRCLCPSCTSRLIGLLLLHASCASSWETLAHWSGSGKRTSRHPSAARTRRPKARSGGWRSDNAFPAELTYACTPTMQRDTR
jgi:serine/threonine protein kinase